MVDDAIHLFECSRTAKRSAKGTDIVSYLRRQDTADQIQWTPLVGRLGESVDLNLDGPNIKVNEKFRFNVPATSIILVHEAWHRVTNDHSLDEEIGSREIQDDYYQELTTGVACTKLGAVKIVTVPTDFVDLRSWRAKDQVIDFVLSKDTYQSKLTAGWVKSNITKFGGLKNRWATTRGLYIQALAAQQEGGELILDMLETVVQKTELDEIRRVAGPEWKVRQALGRVQYSRTQWDRAKRLQTRWSIDLGTR